MSGHLDPDLIAGFLDEAGHELATLNDRLLDVERGTPGDSVVDEMFRAAHSLKGAAGFLNLEAVVEVTHRLETVLDRVRKGDGTFDEAMVEVLFQAFDTLGALLVGLGSGDLAGVAIDATIEALDTLLAEDQDASGDAVDGLDEHLGPLPEWLRGQLNELDACEAIVAQAGGERIFALRLSLQETFAAGLDPLRVHRLLAERVRLQAVIPLPHGPADPFAPLEDFGYDLGVFCFCAHDLGETLAEVTMPPMQVWELGATITDREPRRLAGRAGIDLGQRGQTLIVREDMRKHRDNWLAQTREDLDALENAVLELEQAPTVAGYLDEVFRYVHRLKGGAAAMGLDEMARVAHNTESLLAGLRATGIQPDDEVFKLLFLLRDHLRACTEAVAVDDTQAPDAEAIDARLAPLLDHHRGRAATTGGLPAWELDDAQQRAAEAATADGQRVWKIRLTLRPGTPMPEIRFGMILHNLAGAGTLLFADPDSDSLADEGPEPTALRALLACDGDESAFRDTLAVDLVHQCAIEPVAGATAARSGGTGLPGGRADTIRVDAERLDRMLNIAGEMLISKARVTQNAEHIGGLLDALDLRALEVLIAAVRRDRCGNAHEDRLGQLERTIDRLRQAQDLSRELRDGLQELHHHTGAMQSAVMQARMVPIGPLFGRFHRLVRDIGKERDRAVQLVTKGETTELDKRLIDELADPLTHLLRNAVDHGLEDASERRAAGKPETGTVHLEAFHAGGQICVRVSDDGRGLDRARIQAKAIERGLIDADGAEIMSEAETYALVFRPGFSTAATVTNISGRGVGMDIVHNRIIELGGTVEIASRPGQGSTFTLRLPLTLAMIDALMVRIGGSRYAFPLESVREIVEVAPEQVCSPRGRGHMITLRDRVIALVDPADAIGTAPVDAGAVIRAVVIRIGADHLAVRVDRVLGDEEIVVKALGSEFEGVRGISGATVLGDGGVALILDPAGFASARASGTERAA